jgi:hypothetical protein
VACPTPSSPAGARSTSTTCSDRSPTFGGSSIPTGRRSSSRRPSPSTPQDTRSNPEPRSRCSPICSGTDTPSSTTPTTTAAWRRARQP